LKVLLGHRVEHEISLTEDLVDLLDPEGQHDLFDLGAELCLPGSMRITDTHVARLEVQLDEINKGLGRLEGFILPGGTFASVTVHGRPVHPPRA